MAVSVFPQSEMSPSTTKVFNSVVIVTDVSVKFENIAVGILTQVLASKISYLKVEECLCC